MAIFNQKFYDYLLLSVSGIVTFSIGVYYLVCQNRYRAIKQNQINKNNVPNLDPVVDNVYWSIASLVVYYSVYLGLKYLGYKDQAAWIIILSIVLGKIGLAAFSSYYYQKNNFDQNLEKSFHPGYFIHQDAAKIILTLIGYGALALLIGYDLKKPTKKKTILNNNPKPNKNNVINEVEEKKQALAFLFQSTIDSTLKYVEYFSDVWQGLQNKSFFDYQKFLKSIKHGIQTEKISETGVQSLIEFDFGEEAEETENYFLKKNYHEKPLLNCFIDCLTFFFKQEEGPETDEAQKGMADVFLNELIKEPSDIKINSLKKTINEFYYFGNCFLNLQQNLFGEVLFFIGKNNFKTAAEIKLFHFNFLHKLIKSSQNITSQDNIEAYHYFLTKNKKKLLVSKKMFLDALNEANKFNSKPCSFCAV